MFVRSPPPRSLRARTAVCQEFRVTSHPLPNNLYCFNVSKRCLWSWLLPCPPLWLLFAVLGLQYGKAVDMWSVGCTLFELYTGKYAFAGRSNNEMMKLFMDLKGRFPPKLVKRARFKDDHFDADHNLLFRERDPVTNQERTRVLTYPKPTRDLKEALLAVAEADPADKRRVLQFVDLLNKMFVVDPSKRITAAEALKHPFVQ